MCKDCRVVSRESVLISHSDVIGLLLDGRPSVLGSAPVRNEAGRQRVLVRFKNLRATTQPRLPMAGHTYDLSWSPPCVSGCSGSPAGSRKRLTGVRSSGLGRQRAMGTVVFRRCSTVLSMSCGEGGNQTAPVDRKGGWVIPVLVPRWRSLRTGTSTPGNRAGITGEVQCSLAAASGAGITRNAGPGTQGLAGRQRHRAFVTVWA